jgi:cysteine-rich repeat protein
VCGDGYKYSSVEQCDDANTVQTDACLIGCVSASCGDGYIWNGVEQCEDGNTNTSDACPACRFATCGDGYVARRCRGV